jgi:hypothetical protein
MVTANRVITHFEATRDAHPRGNLLVLDGNRFDRKSCWVELEGNIPEMVIDKHDDVDIVSLEPIGEHYIGTKVYFPQME